MIIKLLSSRPFHTNVALWELNKSALATLRKKTGYTFVNCKKALEMHNNDLAMAEEWLRKQAESLGWMKATKLQGRKTTQGLIGVGVQNNLAAMVEINCETDFVARNEHFQSMVETTVNTCLGLAQATPLNGNLIIKYLEGDEFRSLKCKNGKSLSDHLALMIGTVGENALLKRAVCLKTDDTLQLSGYAHPGNVFKNDVSLGRIAGVVAFKSNGNVDDLGKKLCQHIVGMDPKKIGCSEDVPSENVDNESCLIYQSYLHDESYTVDEVLKENEVEVVNFKRFECGETDLDETVPEAIETCQ